MGISADTIKKYIREQIYNDACMLFDDGKVLVDKKSGFWKGEAGVKGTVNGYRCLLNISNDEIISYGCTCEDFKTKRKMCRHIAALGLAHIKSNEIENQAVVYTSGEVKNIVSLYLKRAQRGNFDEDRIYDLELLCCIEADSHSVAAEFFIAKNKRKFQVKNLWEFQELFAKEETVEYGNGFKVVHDISSFKECDRILVDYILKYIKHFKALASVSGRLNDEIYVKDLRKLIFVGKHLDEFMAILCSLGKKIIFRNKKRLSQNERNINIVRENPDVKIEVCPITNQGYKVELSGADNVICGEEGLYVIDDSVLYIADKEYAASMSEFLDEAVKAERDGGTRKYKLVINKKDMPAFCNLVLSGIKKFCDVTEKDMDMDEFEPWERICSCDVNMVGDNLVCKVNCSYRDSKFDLFKGINGLMGICRDYSRESMLKSVLLKYFPEGAADGSLSTNDYRHIFEFLKSGVKELERFGEVLLSEEASKYNVIDSMKINADVSIEGNWLKLDIDAGEYSRQELESLLFAYRRKEKYIKLGENRLVKLDDNGLELLAQMAYDLDFSATDIINHQVFIPKYRALYIDGRLREGDLATYDKDAAFRALVRTIKQVEDSEFMVPEELEEVLRGYQKLGFHWLRTLDACGFGGILADDMGLGKTLQIITLLLDEKMSVSRNVPSLIIAPSSLVYNWENEIKHFAPELTCQTITGTKEERRRLLSRYGEKDVLITSYELLKRDIDLYEELSFRFQVIDEAQSIKNYSTANAKSVKKIKAQTRFALTGTPIENRLSELWSIFDYLMPGFLYSYTKFKEKFERPISVNNEIEAIKGLTRIIGPFVLRRLKKDVLKELPEKQEYDVFAKLEGKQQKLYVANALRLRDIIEKTDDDSFGDNRMKILSELMRLRQLCCDPSLCYEDYDGESSKLELCIDMVRNGVSGGHKILIFSQFTSMLDIIAKRFEEENISYYMLTGATSKENRIKMVMNFNEDDTNVFLISLKAGGVGLNLTGADMVIHYDPWWNVAAENQASDRTHRIGQDKVVSVFKLISKNTIEERIRELQKRKAKLADNILNGETISLSNLSKNELLSILNS